MLGWLKKNRAAYGFLRHQVYGRLRSVDRQKVFSEVYRSNAWQDSDSVSGPGSNLAATEHVRDALPSMVRELGITSLLDLPCGDYHWMNSVPLGVPYIGADLVASLIESNRQSYPAVDFRQIDLLKDDLPEADAIFCRDCMVHLSLRDIDRALNNIRRSGARYLLATTFPDLKINEDTVTPYWRPVNMALWLGEPEALVRDYSNEQKNDQGKHLGAWRVG